MSKTNYTDKPFSMNDRPAELQDSHNNDELIEKSNGSLPKIMWQDYGATPAGEVARAARMEKRVIESMQESKVAPSTLKIIGASLAGAAVGATIGILARFAIDKLPLHINEEYKKIIGEAFITAGMVAGLHAGEKIISPKHVNTVSEETKELMEQATNQKIKAYLSALEYEKAKNNIAPFNKINSADPQERLQSSQEKQPMVAS